LNDQSKEELSSSVSSSREGETPQQSEEKKDEGLLGYTGGGLMSDWKPIEACDITSRPGEERRRILVTGRKFHNQIGYVIDYGDGTRHVAAEGFHGDWEITHWMPLPSHRPLQAQSPACDSQVVEPSNEKSSAFSDQGETPAAPVEPARCKNCGATQPTTDCDATGWACEMERASPRLPAGAPDRE
jgi:hypothetical protein